LKESTWKVSAYIREIEGTTAVDKMARLGISSFVMFPHFGLSNAKARKPHLKFKVMGLPERPTRK
jgi:hypothetical protein